jgi:hypothetical protein
MTDVFGESVLVRRGPAGTDELYLMDTLSFECR